MKTGAVHIGTSGWKYKHWNGVFYPKEIRQADQFQFYTQGFNTVELNNSFYRQPSKENFKEWKAQSPEGFTFAVKANRYFTHLKKLNVSADDLRGFLDRTDQLGKALGPILFQLPPGWKVNTERLDRFLQLLPSTGRYAFEFRNHTWYTEEVFSLLRKYHVAFCAYELDGHISPIEVTAPFVYVRLHGPGAKYQGSYTDEQLQSWAGLIGSWSKAGKAVYVYFDNDQAGYAAFNAKRLKELL